MLTTRWVVPAANPAPVPPPVPLPPPAPQGLSHHELSEAGALHVYRDVGQLHDWLLTSPLAQLAPP